MKVRWTGGSVRLRITPGELEALAQGEPVTERLALPGGEWGAELRPGDGSRGLALDGGHLVFTLAADDVARLVEPYREGVYFDPDASAGAPRWYVEKDFPCAHPSAAEAAEPPTATFVPPPAFAARKEAEGED